jgi:hypothetical protein
MSLMEDGDLCRVTVEGPQRGVDLALPVDVPFAELLPVILSYSGRELAEAGLEHDGWVLQRLDETAIDESMTPAQVSLTHGDVLYLRPAMRQLPELSVGEADTSGDADPGSAEWLHALAVSVAGGVSAAAAALLLLGGLSWIVLTIITGVLSLVLLGLGAVASRFSWMSGIGLACGLGALPQAFLSGLHTTDLAHIDLRHFLPGVGALALAAVIASVPVSRLVPVFSLVAGTAMAATAAAGVALIVPELSVAAAAALVTAGVLTVQRAFQQIMPRIKARMPHVPMHLEEALPEPRGSWSYWKEGMQTGLTLSIGVTGALAAGLLAFSSDGLGWVACAAFSLILIVRSRDEQSDVTRHALVLSGTTGLALLLIGLSHASSPSVAAGLLAALFAGAVALVAVCLWLSRRPRQPFPSGSRQPLSSWSRALGIAEVALMLGSVLLALAEAGLFAGNGGL